MTKVKLSSLLRIVISLSLFVLLLWLARENFAKIRQLLNSANKIIFFLAFLCFLCSNNFMAWRLKVVFSAQGIRLKVRDLFPLTLVGHFFTNFMPSSVGGDLVKGHFISQKIKSRVSSYTSILIDRMMGLFSLVIIASLALLTIGKDIEHHFVFLAIGLLLLFCVVSILVLFNRRLQKKLSEHVRLANLLKTLKLDVAAKKISVSLTTYMNNKKKIAQIFILSVISQFISFFAVYLLSKSLAAQIPFAQVLIIMPIIASLCMLPVTMNGLGLREWAFIFFFSPTVGNATALSLSLLYLAMFLLTSLMGGIIYLLWR